jgi:hypothetical protein
MGVATAVRGVPVCAGHAGTSRLVILAADGLEFVEAEGIMRDIATGAKALPMAVTSHYQDRKFALVWQAQSPHHFFFRFYQFDTASDSLIANMECGNAAAACGAFTLLAGLVELDPDGAIIGENLGTDQRVRLCPADPARIGDCAWQVSFLHDDFRLGSLNWGEAAARLPGLPELPFAHLDRGNRFLFARLDPDSAKEEIAELLKQTGAALVGADQNYRPKILCYSVDAVHGDHAWLRAVCWFEGERHRSLPGSAAMSLAGLLTLTALEAHPRPFAEGTFRFTIAHPSDQLEVEAEWAWEPDGYCVRVTRFVSPVRISFGGSVFVDEQA